MNDFSQPPLLQRIRKASVIVEGTVALLMIPLMWVGAEALLKGILVLLGIAFLAEVVASLRLMLLRRRLRAEECRLCTRCGEPFRGTKPRDGCGRCGAAFSPVEAEKLWRAALADRAL